MIAAEKEVCGLVRDQSRPASFRLTGADQDHAVSNFRAIAVVQTDDEDMGVGRTDLEATRRQVGSHFLHDGTDFLRRERFFDAIGDGREIVVGDQSCELAAVVCSG